MRSFVVKALGENCKDDPDTKTWLKHHATQDNHANVRSAAVKALADNFKNDPDTLPILKHRATADDEWRVRSAAVEALGKYFQYQPELFDIYYNCAVNDPFQREEGKRQTNPPRVALEIIIKQFPQHPQTLPLLRDKAENDPDEVVREYARKKLREWENNIDGEMGSEKVT